MKEFFNRMREVLSPDELEIFKNEYNKPHFRGVRVNTLKCSVDKFLSLTHKMGIGDVTPFCSEGFYIEGDCELTGNHPLHHSGAVYFQEPSAMSAVSLLSPDKGDFVLDLCAAPGGKSTQIASALGGSGLVWSNEVVRNRANILLSNMERCGVGNAVVSSCDAEVLCSALEGFFDKVLVDAPCSGEGMFRRGDGARSEWSAEHSDSCAVRQLKILTSAKKALRPGGVMVYSTCTFSKAENEDVVEKFLAENEDFELVECTEGFGRKGLDNKSVRIFPMDGGEGHFAAKFVKKSEEDFARISPCNEVALTPKNKLPPCVGEFLEDAFIDTSSYSNLVMIGDKVYALPCCVPDVRGLSVIRAGVLAGEVKKNRFEPEHSLYMSADIANIKRVVDIGKDDRRINKFLHGEEIDVDSSIRGYAAVAYCGIITGFGKASSGKLKNKYPKGLRTL